MIPMDAHVLTEAGEVIAGLVYMLAACLLWFLAGFAIGTLRDTAFKVRQIERSGRASVEEAIADIDKEMRERGFTAAEEIEH